MIESARPEQGRVEYLRPVCGGHDSYVPELLDSVHFVEELAEHSVGNVSATLVSFVLG